jgi:hypothetical protein
VSTQIFGIRHHGPGCARSLRDALTALAPDIVLVEGPPDAHAVLPLLMNETMQPPVALLVYAPETPRRAVFYPFTVFSPEWQALHYALMRDIPARFIDLPQAFSLALEAEREGESDAAPATPEKRKNGETLEETPAESTTPTLRDDPIGILAEAAGYADHELWWEHQIEQRRDATNLFGGIMEAMTALRSDTPAPEGREALREAHMRQAIRAAEREGYTRIAIVCGAWHAPVLADYGTAKADAALLKGLRRIKVDATWIPWTNSRLSYRSGYGAGVRSPGWYQHLWTAPDRHAIRWVAKAAGLLRAADLDASSSNVIEAVRLGETLAALRDLPMPGLAELHEAIQTTLCGGDPAPMRLIHDQLEIGETLGAVPEETPAVPLQRDLAAAQRRLRLPPTAEIKTLDLDLRTETDRARSHLLHRLSALDVHWGRPEETHGKAGTFHEFWTIRWQPEFAVSVIEASVWGNTLAVAATAALRHAADTATDLPELTALLDRAILATLPDAVDHLLWRVQERAAISADVRHLMAALPPLARIARYGNVRETKRDQVLPVIDGLFARVIVGLPGACATLDDDAAALMIASFAQMEESLALLDNAAMRSEWQAVLRVLLARGGVHGRVRGRCCRLLLDAGVLDGAELHRLARLALSTVTPAAEAAAWIEGVAQGSGMLLLHQDGLWAALDAWLRDLRPEPFVELLPLLRRAFADFQPPERRAMGERVKHLHGDRPGADMLDSEAAMDRIDTERASRVLPVLAQILGVSANGDR